MIDGQLQRQWSDNGQPPEQNENKMGTKSAGQGGPVSMPVRGVRRTRCPRMGFFGEHWRTLRRHGKCLPVPSTVERRGLKLLAANIGCDLAEQV